jgi:hypothetical protein
MSTAEIERFRRAVNQLLVSYERSLERLEQLHASRNGIPLQDVRGRGRDIALEAHARAYLLDPLLSALGWQVDTTDLMVIEDTLETADQGEGHRRRLDYHGREQNGGRSLLIVESKRPSVQLPTTRDGNIGGAIGQALFQVRLGRDIPVSALWTEILTSARDYAERVTKNSGETPERFVISNGEWFAVFPNVDATLLAKDPEVATIRVFSNLSDVGKRAAEFYQLLSYQALSGYIPPQHPAALEEFIPDRKEALCARVVDVDYVRYGDRQPLLSLRVGIWVRTNQGAWVFFRKDYPKPFVVLSDDGAALSGALIEINDRANDLLESLRARCPIRFLTRREIEDYPPPEMDSKPFVSRTTAFVEIIETNRYRMITAEHAHYLVEDESFDQCPHHEWGACKQSGDAVGLSPIAAQSCDPPCFFPSGSRYHCAHAGIHASRRNKCLLLPFEEYLCCRRCVYLARCWPEDSAMPCVRTSQT